jgi:hypothetical protein
MKVIFEFNLPEDQHEYDIMSQSTRIHSFLWDFSQQLRSWQKYSNDFQNAGDALDKIRTEFYRLLSEQQINIDL